MKKTACTILSVLMLMLLVSCSDNSKEHNEFDAYGNQLKQVEYVDGILRKKTEYNYENAKCRSYTIYEYGGSNKLLKTTSYDKNDTVTCYEETLENYPDGSAKVSKSYFNDRVCIILP